MSSEDPAGLVRRALSGDPASLRGLVAALTPVIQARVARTLLARRYRLAGGRDVRQEVEDLSQDVFLALFSRDGRVLRTWQAERGLSLESFVGLIAERQVLSFLRSGRRNPWKEDASFTAEETKLDIDHSRFSQARQRLEDLRQYLPSAAPSILEEASPNSIGIHASRRSGSMLFSTLRLPIFKRADEGKRAWPWMRRVPSLRTRLRTNAFGGSIWKPERSWSKIQRVHSSFTISSPARLNDLFRWRGVSGPRSVSPGGRPE